LFDSAKNEMLHHILKSLGSNQLSFIQFKSPIATYFLKIEKLFTVRNNRSTVLKLVTIVLDISRYTKYQLHNACIYIYIYYVVGPCHHGMARPQVADRGTASDKEGSCE